MDSRTSDFQAGISIDAPFRMVTIYDSPEASRQASHASRVVLQELGDEICVDRTAWDLRALDVRGTCARAAAEAARADVIVVASSGTEASEALKNWVTQWEKSRTLNGGLIAFIPSGSSETGGDLASYLYETAVSANMDFLCRKKLLRRLI
jgi:hypothetical protein